LPLIKYKLNLTPSIGFLVSASTFVNTIPPASRVFLTIALTSSLGRTLTFVESPVIKALFPIFI